MQFESSKERRKCNYNLITGNYKVGNKIDYDSKKHKNISQRTRNTAKKFFKKMNSLE